ncbi:MULTISPECIES: isocitrate/isopropylmalate dehydrogenase family protein [unclassified Methanoculleus]|uniref:isocitrate/isopropylmalate dehydrogenase family protein n=1 Tax=unclassified Methanoculleus TaxID=2619537 RepID=UPI0025D90464|nr:MULTISPECIES: isocitrate/isopropylmalate dehydrogenase family protein [unclassified Methanoculleus]MCK9318108.1 isocitrate/isopropylmalate dehydrogenase family protein [Methanoculleus sp.]MDD2253342.1 isocitrate/isopropylmalate dehydrogenase family protein [Methanoculleus sp.]MDD2787792.1 isocitrate/isopropylmalate dehydrogenase family protein [Methanoculleus sp.]MDD3216109.1 isocitrate/isopropylmalate dehydrogenase family protein [Methanoculleus sp.]MDD4314050.1 isocitrate/isopropylmalate 
MVKVAVVEGDGIGHEVVPIARDILAAVRPDFEFFDVEVGYGLWERTGSACGEETMADLRSADATLFGAVTTPPDPDYRSVMLQIRHALDLYANVRPIRDEAVDIIIVRENTEGLYSGIEWTEPDRACTVRVVSRRGSERIARYACTLAKSRRHLTVGNKANVLKSDCLFVEVCLAEAARVGVPCTARYIDALCLDLLMHPGGYDVVVTTNMFGDILSDAAAYLVGGLGMLPSANIGKRAALFEPVHGSAPDIAGRNIANPIAAIRSGAMLLSHFGDPASAVAVEDAVSRVLRAGIRTRDLGGSAGTREFGTAVLREVERRKA